MKIPLEINNAMYTIDENAVGTIALSVSSEYGDAVKEPFEYTIGKQFDMDAVKSLDKITDVKFGEDGKASMTAGTMEDIQPELEGLDTDDLTVVWQTSSDPTVASISTDGKIAAKKSGSATLTGYVLPKKQYFKFDNYGRCTEISAADTIPADKLRIVEVELNVSGANDSTDAILGDLDGDGQITSADALFVLRISAGLEKETADNKLLADVDGDGQITSADALEILRNSAGMGSNENIGKKIAA